MDYQLTQTGAEVQGILNQAPVVVTVGALNTIDAVGNYLVTDGDGNARGSLICALSGPQNAQFYLQTYIHDGAIYSRSGNTLPLTGEWVNPLQNKVDKETGKGLSTNDFTTALKEKLEDMTDVMEVDVSEIDGFIDNDDEGLYWVSGNTSVPFLMQMYRDAAYAYQWMVEPHSGKILIRNYNTQAASPAWSEFADAYADKQDTISDLATIRSGAAAGATAYQKPSTGIPKTDLAAPVQTSLGKADTSVQPAALTPIQNALSVIESLIPGTASAQNQLADKNYVDTHSTDIDVDDALSTTSENPVQNKVVTTALNGKQATISDLSTIRSGAAAGATAYQKPNTGIPKTDLASAVQTSLGKADAAAPQETTYTKDEVDAIIENIDTPITEIQRSALDSTTTPGIYKVVGTTGSSAANSSWVSLLLVSDYDFSMVGGSTNHIVTQRLFNGRGASDSIKLEERTKTNNDAWSEWTDIYGSDIDEIWEELDLKQDTISDLTTIRSGAAAGATAVQPAAMNTALAGKQDTISDLSTIRSGASAGATAVQPATMNTALATKQDTISDLSTIRSGAAAGATAYQKPSTGIPKTDLASAVQTSLDKADSALQSHQSLANYYTKSQVDNLIVPQGMDALPVTALPATGDANTLYFLQGTNSFTINAWDGSAWVTLATIAGTYDAGGALS